MRKIDALLLSALILYDYSAQSLAGDNYINNTQDSYHVDSLQIFTGDMFEFPVKENDIHYYELPEIIVHAKKQTPEMVVDILPELAPEALTISVPDAFAEVLPEAPEEEMVMEEAVGINVEKVSISERAIKDLLELDSDNDGVPDYEDKCINVAGVARFEGCPVPDSDWDGVNDEEDKCPFEAGSLENGGCPVQIDEVDFSQGTPEEVVETNDSTVEMNADTYPETGAEDPGFDTLSAGGAGTAYYLSVLLNFFHLQMTT